MNTLFNIIYIMRTLGFTSGVVIRSFSSPTADNHRLGVMIDSRSAKSQKTCDEM